MPSVPDPGRVLLLLARDPDAPSTGRTMVLETAVHALRRRGSAVLVVAICSGEGADTWLGCPVVRVPPPGLAEVGSSAARALLGRGTLNEALLDGRRVRADVRRWATESSTDVVVADSLRVVPAAVGTGLPVIAHLDDLLSERYAAVEYREGNDSVLGYAGDRVPRLVRPIAEWCARRALSAEARRCARREVEIASSVAVTALTGSDEAGRLAARSGRPVTALPMAIDARPAVDPASADPASAVFLGALHTGPNLAALRFLRDDVLPRVRDRGVPVHVTVIGAHRPDLASEFPREHFTFRGFVPDLGDALSGHRMFLSPILAGTGVKTKVLDALSVGLPVVATRLGVAGVPVQDGVSALIEDEVERLADAVALLAADGPLARRIGQAGREVLTSQMRRTTVEAGWDHAMTEALSMRASRRAS